MKNRRNKKVSVLDKSIPEMRHAYATMSKRELQYQLDMRMDKDWRNQEEKELNTPLLHLDGTHKAPVSRRDFLSRGLIAATASALVPSIPNFAFGQSAPCPTGGTTFSHIPFFTIDASGGMQMAGTNYAVGPNGQVDAPLTSYATFGVKGTPTWVRTAGIPMHTGSYVLEGIVQTASAAALAKTSGFVIGAASGDDSSANKLNQASALASKGVVGELAGAIGTSTDFSGGNSDSDILTPAYRSTQVANSAQAQQLNQPGIISQVLTGPGQANVLVEKVSELTTLQANKLNPGAVATKTKDVIICGGQKNVSNFKAAAVNPGADAGVAAVFPQINNNNSPDSRVGTAAFLALAGKVGPATIEFGGRDYHNNNNQQQRDNELGRSIGQLIEYANRMNTPIVITHITDGSTSAAGTDDTLGRFFQPANDNGNCSCIAVFAFDPTGRVPVTKELVGSYGSNGVVANSSAFSNNPQVASRIVTANYFFLMNKMADFNALFPTPGFNVADVIAFARPIK